MPLNDQKCDEDGGSKLKPSTQATRETHSSFNLHTIGPHTQNTYKEARVWVECDLIGWRLPNEAILGVSAFK